MLNEGEKYAYDTVTNIFDRAEELEMMGLSLPVVTKIMLEIQKRGYDVSKHVFTSQEAVASLLPLLNRN